MTSRFSLYLDAMRFLAALIVLLSHFAYPRFSRGDYIFIRDMNLGSDAVVFFFVLSGLVIAFTAANKDRTPGLFAFNRLTRLYSVVFPAVVLTVLFDWIGRSLDPAAYSGVWYNAHAPWDQAARAVLLNLEWGLSAIRFGSNGPFWSLSYEAAYYLLFGIAIFTKGPWRISGLLIVSLIAGPAVLLLLPVWLLGIVVYHRLDATKSMPDMLLWVLTIAPALLYPFCLFVQLPHTLLDLTLQLLGPEIVNARLRFSNEFVWNWMIGVMVATHLIGVAGLIQTRSKSETLNTDGRFLLERGIRWGAGASFSLYLVHYPALQLVDAVLSETVSPLLRDTILLSAVLAICLLFARYFERPVGQLRRWLSELHASNVRVDRTKGVR